MFDRTKIVHYLNTSLDEPAATYWDGFCEAQKNECADQLILSIYGNAVDVLRRIAYQVLHEITPDSSILQYHPVFVGNYLLTGSLLNVLNSDHRLFHKWDRLPDHLRDKYIRTAMKHCDRLVIDACDTFEKDLVYDAETASAW
jgi:hypothetical protein